MLPIILESSRLRVAVAGAGEGLTRRLGMLAAAGVAKPAIFTQRLPEPNEIATFSVLFVAGLGDEESTRLAAMARAARVLVNVEDRPALCDFHVPAQVRRGDLCITVSTGGRSPALSRIVRERIEADIGPEWDRHLDEISDARAKWRDAGLEPDEISQRTRALVLDKGWVT